MNYIPVSDLTEVPIYTNTLYNLDLDGTIFRNRKVFVPEGIRLSSGRITYKRLMDEFYSPGTEEWLNQISDPQLNNVVDIVTARNNQETTIEELEDFQIKYRNIFLGTDKGLACLLSRGSDSYERQVFVDDRPQFIDQVYKADSRIEIYRVCPQLVAKLEYRAKKKNGY